MTAFAFTVSLVSKDTRRPMSDVPPSSAIRSRYRFDATPFEPDRIAPLGGTLQLFLLTIVTGAGCGWLVAQLEQAAPCFVCCLHGFFVHILISLVVSAIGVMGVRYGKVRHPVVAVGAGITGMLAMAIARLVTDYQFHIEKMARMRQPIPDFFDYLQTLEGGIYLSLTFGILIASGSCVVAMANAARQPFCRACERWKTEQRLGAVFMPTNLAIEVLGQGSLPDLAAHPIATKRVVGPDGRIIWRFGEYVDVEAGPLEVVVHVCSHCGLHEPIEIQIQQVMAVSRSKLLRQVFGIWTYPGEAGLVLDKLFPQQLHLPETQHDHERI